MAMDGEDSGRTSRLSSSELERTILDTLSQPLLVVDEKHVVVSANQAFYALFQTTDQTAQKTPILDVADHALDHPKMRELLAALRGDGLRVTEVMVPLAKTVLGRRVFLVNARRMEGERVLFSFEDVTERLDAGEKLERRALLLESMSDAVIAGDMSFQIQEWNPAAERLFGWTAAEVRGRRVEEILTVVNIDREKNREQLRQGGKTLRSQMRVQNRSGHWLDIEFSSMPVKHGGVVTGFVSVMQDVSDRIRLEREAHEQLTAVEAANKELEAFSYTVSHDLRAPVRAIDGFSRLLEEDYGKTLDDEGRRLLGVIRKSANRMGDLIDDLLAFSRLGRQEITKTKVDMDALARDAFEEARRLEANREIKLEMTDALPHAYGDRGLVMQVWQNLLTNAVKYSRGRSPAIIRVNGEANETETLYHVSDNGAGFDMRYAHKLFGVFERLHTNAQFEGTGVGLALVQRVVTRHGGRIWAEAELDVGATFHFTLPHAAEKQT